MARADTADAVIRLAVCVGKAHNTSELNLAGASSAYVARTAVGVICAWSMEIVGANRILAFDRLGTAELAAVRVGPTPIQDRASVDAAGTARAAHLGLAI
jgi:hypothetical protein